MEDSAHFTALFNKYLHNLCSPAEVEELLQLLQDDARRQQAEQLIGGRLAATEQPVKDPALRQRLEQRLQRILAAEQAGHNMLPAAVPQQPGRVRRLYGRWWAAAGIVLLLALAGYWWAGRGNRGLHTGAVAYQPGITVPHIRSVVLPDGSRVVLQAGSSLDYTPGFGRSNREVILRGEAYFDISRSGGAPFSIRTGNVTTTVLGTAFNIRSFEGSGKIMVSVERGKVKVTEGSRELAVLGQQQAIIYHTATDSLERQTLREAAPVAAWAGQDMHFRSASLAAIAGALAARYGTPVHLGNEAMGRCLVTVAFKGTESLPEVLSAICTILDCSYEIKDKGEVLISGKGC